MIKFDCDYLKYLSRKRKLDYLMLDPPWYYKVSKKQVEKPFYPGNRYPGANKFYYWGKDNEQELLKLLKISSDLDIKAVAIWSTLPMLQSVMKAIFSKEHNYEFKSLITWVKVHKSGKSASVMAYYFHNTTEYLVIIKNKSFSIPRTNVRTHWIGVRGARTQKPKDLESELMNSWPGKWAYIFSGPFVNELSLDKGVKLDCIDICYTLSG